MKVLISGGSGLVGAALTGALRAEGHTVCHLVRPGGSAAPGDVQWNPLSALVDVPAMEGFDAVVNLNGASIGGGRWTPKRKTILRSSRVDSTRVLVDALSHLRQPPRVLVCASATGYYGNRGDEVLKETSGYGNDFLAILCRAWEGEAARGLRGAIDDARWNGPVNLVSPEPVRNSEFTRVLASVLHRPAIFPAPAFALRLALGEMADALLLSSQRVHTEPPPAATYAFRYENLEPALHAILAKH